jgi:hypothetical protein
MSATKFHTHTKQQAKLRFGTWNVRSLYSAGSLVAAARELARYKLDLVGVHEVRWDKEGTVRAGDCGFIYGKGNEYHQLETGFVHLTPVTLRNSACSPT